MAEVLTTMSVFHSFAAVVVFGLMTFSAVRLAETQRP
jgi:hypothetical protein